MYQKSTYLFVDACKYILHEHISKAYCKAELKVVLYRDQKECLYERSLC